MINFQIFWKSGPRITVSRGNNCQLFTKISRKCKITTVSPQYSVYHRRMRKFENNHQLVQGGTGKSGIYPVYILRVHISKTTYPNFTKFSVHATHGCCMVVHWRRCSMLRTSSLVDGVIFSHSGPYGTGDAKCSSNWLTGGIVHFTSQRILKLTCKVATMDWGWCLMSVIALFLSYDIITSMCSEEVRNIIRWEHVS